MEKLTNPDTLKELIEGSSKILIATRERPSVDGLAAMLGLAQVFTENGKNVALACSGEIPVEAKDLVGIDKINPNLKATNLVISFDYVQGSVEKVSYNIDGDRFNLILSSNDDSLDPSKINFNKTKNDFDLVVLVDTPKIEYLGKINENDPDTFSKLPTLNIDHHSNNTGFGSYHWVWDKESSTSELIFDIINRLEVTLSKETASLLLYGIRSATDNLTKDIKAETLERAAACLRALGEVEGKEDSLPVTPDESWFAPKIYRSSKIIE